MGDVALISWKELTQIGTRGRFHLEKALFALSAGAGVAVMAMQETALDRAALEEAATFGRTAFFIIMMGTVAVTSAIALVAASGIVLSERLGGRLDVLRVTAISLPAIVGGKGMALFGRAMLVAFLVLPVAAATQLFGGVSLADMVKAFSIVAVTVFFCVSLGLFISCGSKSTIERAAKLINVAVAAAVVLWLGRRWLTGTTVKPLLCLSPFGVWHLLRAGSLTWDLVGTNALMYGALGLALLVGASARRALDVERERTAVEAPTAREVVGYLERLRARWRRAAPLSRLRRLPWRSPPKGRGYLADLVAVEMKRTSVLALLIPPAFFLSWLVMFAASLLRGMGRLQLVETLQAGTEFLVGGIMLAVLIEGCSSMTREKARHSAQLLTLTPLGGPGAALWKAAAVFAAQSVMVALAALMILVSGMASHAGLLEIVSDLLGFATGLAFAFIVGVSFSLAARTSMRAAGALALSLVLLVPAFANSLFVPRAVSPRTSARLAEVAGDLYVARGAVSHWLAANLHLLALAAFGLLALRHVLPRAACALTTVCLAAAIAALSLALGYKAWESGHVWYDNCLASLTFVFGFWRGAPGATLSLAGVKVAAAAVLALGIPINFRRLVAGAPERRHAL